ncbi:glycosyltransferase family 4 protein [Virgibacillus sp. W0430]|uniref:glycosyltransferase family 4 protein n=1 Tax=Virgibacillus sp. W0430 TaxID=3391580 RepID=UPI003F45B24B
MNVKLIVPFFDQQRGNTITVKRINNGLSARGLQTEVINATAEVSAHVSLTADIYHGFHAYQFYNFMNKVNDSVQPYVLTMTGTDLNKDLFNEAKRAQVIETLQGAEAIHVFEEQGMKTVAREVPGVSGKLYVIPQSISPFPQTNSLHIKEKGTFLFILPAGLRKIKNIPNAIFTLEKLKEEYPHIRLWIVGPVIEADEGEYVKKLVRDRENWVDYIGQLPHEQMGALLKEADVVLNTSISEGQPSAILEAMALGIPPIVSSNHGNKSIVSHNETGFIYRNESEFIDSVQKLIDRPQLREQIGESARVYVNRHHALHNEIEALVKIYKHVLNRR